jgi:hypothetical protein
VSKRQAEKRQHTGGKTDQLIRHLFWRYFSNRMQCSQCPMHSQTVLAVTLTRSCLSSRFPTTTLKIGPKQKKKLSKLTNVRKTTKMSERKKQKEGGKKHLKL